ncbi:MAG TPA: TIGR04295 family B12-binding domain-containing radical SAM protein [Terriglobales bacterium]|nr:TIGR04295 family B12-binding domain-containing radical SAM protein [Terriglobales bacterium]
MKFALVNPAWSFEGSTYFGCREPHYPLELLFAAEHIKAAGDETVVIDAQLNQLSIEDVKVRLRRFDPDFLVIPTAPSYLFWRCPPPELRVPQAWFAGLDSQAIRVAIGPHASATPGATLQKLNCDVALRGEPDETLAQLSSRRWSEIDGCCWKTGNGQRLSPALAVADMKSLKTLLFENYNVEAHDHRHHVFSGSGRGAELEFARGCPWSCTFCNKTLFRNKFRERDVEAVLAEVDNLIARGVDYIYWIDEIFGVGKQVKVLLEELRERPISIGLQTRIDLWDEETLDLLGNAHCISMECGIESITTEGRDQLNKGCKLSTDRLSELLIYARERIPWVQANLILTDHDHREEIRNWQENLKKHGVWVSEPVPMFPYPGTPLYLQIFGPPDDLAWERAHHHYTGTFREKGYSDIQEANPRALEDLECTY